LSFSSIVTLKLPLSSWSSIGLTVAAKALSSASSKWTLRNRSTPRSTSSSRIASPWMPLSRVSASALTSAPINGFSFS
jgi:hypothetical protein